MNTQPSELPMCKQNKMLQNSVFAIDEKPNVIQSYILCTYKTRSIRNIMSEDRQLQQLENTVIVY